MNLASEDFFLVRWQIRLLRKFGLALFEYGNSSRGLPRRIFASKFVYSTCKKIRLIYKFIFPQQEISIHKLHKQNTRRYNVELTYAIQRDYFLNEGKLKKII